MLTTTVEINDLKIYEFKDPLSNHHRLVVEFENEYLSAELLERTDDCDNVAVWIYPDKLKGKTIYIEHVVELKLKLEKEVTENRNKLFLNEIADCMINEYKVMENLEHNAAEVVSWAEDFLNLAHYENPDINTLSYNEFVKFRHELKADFNAGKFSKEEYSRHITQSYYSNRNYNILEMKAGINLKEWYEDMRGLKMSHYICRMIYRYIDKNRKNGDLWKYIVTNENFDNNTLSSPKKKPKLKKPKLLYRYQTEYDHIKILRQTSDNKTIVTLEFSDYLLIAELRQEPNNTDEFIVIWLSPEWIKGREIAFYLNQHESQTDNDLNIYSKEVYSEKIFEKQIAERLMLDFQFLRFVSEQHLLLVDLYKKFQQKYAAFPTCSGAISKDEAKLKRKQLSQQKKNGLISVDEHKKEILQIEKDRRKFERMIRNIRDAMYRELKKIFGAPVNYSYFFCFEQLIRENLNSDMLITLYKDEREVI